MGKDDNAILQLNKVADYIRNLEYTPQNIDIIQFINQLIAELEGEYIEISKK